MPEVESIRNERHRPHLIGHEKKGVLGIINHPGSYQPFPDRQARPSHERMCIKVQVVVVFLAESARLLGQTEKRLEPSLLVFRDFL